METSVGKKKVSKTFTDQMREIFKGVIDPVASFLNGMGITPNMVTIAGLVGNAIGAYFLTQGQLFIGGVLVLLMGPVDALDGSMARLRGEPSSFGAFVDSVTDRYSELLILGGLLIYFSQQGNILANILIYMAAAGSVLVSYTRARAQSLGIETKIGILTRMERYMILAPALVLNVPMVALWLLAIFSNITALQRILDVRKKFHSK